jgi:hypothetical protein
MGALHDAVLAASTQAERKAIKAQAWASHALAVGMQGGWNFNYRGYRVDLDADLDASTGNVVFTASLWKAGVDYTPQTLNPITIVNPPYLVEDAAGDVTIVSLDADGQEQTITCRDDANAVLERIVGQLQDLGDKVIDAL